MRKELSALWKNPSELPAYRERLIQWRSEGTIVRVDKPTRADKAHQLGYKAKQGFVLARVKIVKGGRKKPDVQGGRRPATSGRFFTLKKSKNSVAEEKVADKFPNMEVLNSYWVGEDGNHKWFEVILVDKNHPAIKADKTINWITGHQHTGRVYRGLTSAGKRSRGLFKKGKGTEKIRPSLRAHNRRGK